LKEQIRCPPPPEVWLDQQSVNAGPGQVAVPTTQLTNGNILVTWQEIVVVAVPFSINISIHGQILGFDGTPIGGELTLNTLETTGLQTLPSVTAPANGNFAVAYTSEVTSGEGDLIHEVYTSSGTFVRSDRFVNDIGNGNTFDDANAAISAANTGDNAIAAYVIDNDDGSEDIAFRILNTVTGNDGPETILFNGVCGSGEDVSGPEVATLADGSYVMAYVNRNDVPNESLNVRLISAAGVAGNSISVDNSFEDATDTDVTALTGGRFVVAWTVDNTDGTNTGIRYRVYEANGTPVTGVLSPLTTAAGNQVNAKVTGLADGGFVITWEDNEIDAIKGQHFNVNGAAVGVEFTIDGAGTESQGDVQATEDGRFFRHGSRTARSGSSSTTPATAPTPRQPIPMARSSAQSALIWSMRRPTSPTACGTAPTR